MDEPRKRFFESKRSMLSGDRNLLVQVLEGITADMLPCTVTHDEELGSRNATSTHVG
jgi:hypothetical protein